MAKIRNVWANLTPAQHKDKVTKMLAARNRAWIALSPKERERRNKVRLDKYKITRKLKKNGAWRHERIKGPIKPIDHIPEVVEFAVDQPQIEHPRFLTDDLAKLIVAVWKAL